MLWYLAENSKFCALQKSGKPLGVSEKEIEQVIGMFLRMGLARMPCSRLYWETKTQYAHVADIMSRKRFLNIIAHLHFVDSLTVPEEQKCDKLWKIKPWLTDFRKNCLKLVSEEHNSIDEQNVPFKGKFSGIKYIKKKLRKCEFKKWCRCEISGQLYDFDVCQRKKEGSNAQQVIGISGDVQLFQRERTTKPLAIFLLACH